jgi:hypothetical protein
MVDDGIAEDTEFFELTISNAIGGTIGNADVVRINIGNGTGVNNVPNAFAGSSQAVAEGSTVTLDGSQSSDADGDALTFQWTQTLGPEVTLADPSAMTTTFTAPDVSSDMLLQFRLTVADPSGQSDTSMTTVTVADGSSISTGNNSGGGAWDGLIGLLALCLLARRPAAFTVSRMDAA